jgi:DNA-binding MarR family transcriptional regulator
MPDRRENFRAMLEYATTTSRSMEQEAPPSLPMALYGLAAVPSPPTISELAVLTGLTLKNTSRIVKELRRRGWVELQGNPLDERVKLVKLTTEGTEVARLVNGALVGMARRIVANEDEKGAKQRKTGSRFLMNSARTKALMGALVTLHLVGGLIMGQLVAQVMGDDKNITTTMVIGRVLNPRL